MEGHLVDLLYEIISEHDGMNFQKAWQNLKSLCSEARDFFSYHSSSSKFSFFRNNPAFNIGSDGYVALADDDEIPDIDTLEGKATLMLKQYLQGFDELHYEKLANALNQICEDVQNACAGYSTSEKYWFFRNHAEFIISNDGHVVIAKNTEEDCITNIAQSCEESLINFLKSQIPFNGSEHYGALVKTSKNSNSEFRRFFEEYSSSDEFYFFKNRPQHFIIANDGYVSLATNRNQNLISFPNIFTVTNQFVVPCISPVLVKSWENEVVSILSDQLKTGGTVHYQKLLHKAESLSPRVFHFFSGYSDSDKLNFFRNRPADFYVIDSGHVSAMHHKNMAIQYIKEKFQTSGPVHYEALVKQVVQENDGPKKISIFFTNFSGSEKFWFFKNHPDHFSVCKNGFVSVISSEDKVVKFLHEQLVSCNLVHHLEVLKMLKNAPKELSTFFAGFSPSEKFWFFKNHPDHFLIYGNGYVRAMTPECKQFFSCTLIERVESILQKKKKKFKSLYYATMHSGSEFKKYFKNISVSEFRNILHSRRDKFTVMKDDSVYLLSHLDGIKTAVSLSSFRDLSWRRQSFHSDNWSLAGCSSTVKSSTSCSLENISTMDTTRSGVGAENEKTSGKESHASTEVPIKFILKEETESESVAEFVDDPFESQSEDRRETVNDKKKDDFVGEVNDKDVVQQIIKSMKSLKRIHYQDLFVLLQDSDFCSDPELRKFVQKIYASHTDQLNLLNNNCDELILSSDGFVTLRNKSAVIISDVNPLPNTSEEHSSHSCASRFIPCARKNFSCDCLSSSVLSDLHLISVKHLISILSARKELSFKELMKEACKTEKYVAKFFKDFLVRDLMIFFAIHGMYFKITSDGMVSLKEEHFNPDDALVSDSDVLRVIHSLKVELLLICINHLQGHDKLELEQLERKLGSAPAFVLSFFATNYSENYLLSLLAEYPNYFVVDGKKCISLTPDFDVELLNEWRASLFTQQAVGKFSFETGNLISYLDLDDDDSSCSCSEKNTGVAGADDVFVSRSSNSLPTTEANVFASTSCSNGDYSEESSAQVLSNLCSRRDSSCLSNATLNGIEDFSSHFCGKEPAVKINPPVPVEGAETRGLKILDASVDRRVERKGDLAFPSVRSSIRTEPVIDDTVRDASISRLADSIGHDPSTRPDYNNSSKSEIPSSEKTPAVGIYKILIDSVNQARIEVASAKCVLQSFLDLCRSDEDCEVDDLDESSLLIKSRMLSYYSKMESKSVQFFCRLLRNCGLPISVSDMQTFLLAAPDDIRAYLTCQYGSVDFGIFFMKHIDHFSVDSNKFVSLKGKT